MTTDPHPSLIKPFMSNPPPKKKNNFKVPNMFKTFTFFFIFACFTAQKTSNEQTNNTTSRPSPNTLVFHDCIATHRHDDLDTFVTSVTLEFSRRPLTKTWVFTKKTIFWIKKFESSKIGHYYCNSLWLPECLVIFNIKIYQAYEHIIDMCLGWEGWHILNRKSQYGFALNN